MEKIPAACAMNWSIDLEKGVRSNRKGHHEEAIELIEPRILSWSREASVSLSASKMYHLIPGEERSFANAIFIRLADTFLSGSNYIRSSILKIFLLELKKIRKEGKMYGGIVSKQRLPNYLEILRKLLRVFSTGDVTARALALRLLGCWVPLTHDNADVQEIIISGLRSDHVLEMKAAIFACGCLSLMENDFARVIIMILEDILCSGSIPSNVKSAAARAFGEIQCSLLLSSKAYKSVKRLALAASTSGYRDDLLFSLTKLAIKSVILIPELVDFLFTVMAEEDSSITKSMALKCIRYLCSRGTSHIFFKERNLTTLACYVNDPRAPLVIQCEVLKTVRRIFRDVSIICQEYSLDLENLIVCIREAFESKCMEKWHLSLGLLVEISCKYLSTTGNLSLEFISTLSEEKMEEIPEMSFRKDLYHLLLDNIVILINELGNEIKEKHRVLCSYVIRLVQGCPPAGNMILNRLMSLLEDKISQEGVEVDVLACICYCIVPCLDILGENGLIAPEVRSIFRLLLDRLQKLSFYSNDALESVSFKLFLLITRGFGEQWIDCERFALRLARKMESKEKYWLAYKIGKYSSTNGLWFSAAYVFKSLMSKIKSVPCGLWLKSLMLLAGAESEIKLILFPKLGAELVNELFFGAVQVRSVELENSKNYEGLKVLSEKDREKLSRAHARIHSSREVLTTIRTRDGRFWFQTWFLNLREKGLKVLLELLGHLSDPRDVESLTLTLTRISCQFNQLVRECDFMIGSFADMDVKSSTLISSFALYYSLLAYCSGFPFKVSSGLLLVEDLYRRLSDFDRTGVLDLDGLLPFSDWLEGHVDHTRRASSAGELDADIMSVCRFVIIGIHRMLKNDKNKAGFVSFFNDVLVKWMGLPWNLPRYFFRLWDCIGAELFAIADKTLNQKELSTFMGSQLSLHLCIQMKNIPPILRGRISQIHLILTVDQQRSTSNEAEDIKAEESLAMHDLLLSHMRKREKVNADSATCYACMKPNSLGQGFSSCLLDVSDFLEGMYWIRWHGCWVDDDHHTWSLHGFNDLIPFSIKKPSSTDSKANAG